MNPQTEKLPVPDRTGPASSLRPIADPHITTSTDPAATDQAPAANLWTLVKQIHGDQRGGVSIETILIIAAIALPILIFIIKFGWPRIRKFFNEGMDELEGGTLDAAGE